MATFQVHELQPFGAEVQGLDLGGTLDAETVRALRDVFDIQGVVIFADLNLAAEDQAYLTGLLAAKAVMTDRAAIVATTHTYSNYVTNRDKDGYAPFGELLFHCDAMWAPTPMDAISLYGFKVEPPSVPTRFASMAYGFDTLPADLRNRVEGLEALHVQGQQRRGEHSDSLVRIETETVNSSVKPVIFRHPRSGRSLLYVTQQQTAQIEGFEFDVSEALLDELFAHLYRTEAVLEHDWRQGDLVIWDNVALQHARGNVEMEGPERTLRKVIAPKQDMKVAKPKLVQAGAS
jgi:taurine dioxygenase